MDTKKASGVNLENKRVTNILVGFTVVCSLVLVGFEWTMPYNVESVLAGGKDLDIDFEEIEIIPREKEKPKPIEKLPPLKKVIEIVSDDVPMEDIDWSDEVTRDTRYDFRHLDVEPDVEVDEDPIPWIKMENPPTFNGGDPITEFPKYIARNLKYPEIAAENGVSGRVIVQFVIDRTGKLVDPVILRSVDPALDEEAIRVLFTSPRWTPGLQRGKPAEVSYVFPINFVLQ